MAFKDTTERNAMNYYISDLHIGHENILRFDNRPFADVNEMNNKLIENWNARVRSDDTVYILGDFIWAKESEWPSIVGSLGGNKVLIRGNHDPKQFSAATKRMFQEITDLKEIKDSGKHVVMCHYPIPFFRASFASTAFMLYGHVHQTIEYEYIAKLRREVKANSTGYGTPNGNFINACIQFNDSGGNKNGIRNSCAEERLLLCRSQLSGRSRKTPSKMGIDRIAPKRQ